MPKYTLLEIVQEILNDMDGDEVNSIDDTPESTQIALIVRSTFNALMTFRDWPHTKKLLQLTGYANASLPTHIAIQSSIKKLEYLDYNKQRAGETRLQYEPVKYKEPDEFLRMVNSRNSDDTNVVVITDPSGIVLNINNNCPPQYFTSFDDTTLVFDSWDSAIDSTIQSSKIQAMGFVIPSFSIEDDFIPDLPEEAFPALIEEAKLKTMLKLRQTDDPAARAEVRRQQKYLSRNASTVKNGVNYPNYGRKRVK